MLEIFNRLKPFFEDNYRRISVREYARITNVSPPSASKYLEELQREGLLIKEKERNYSFYAAERESKLFIELSRIFWQERFKEMGLIDFFEKELIAPLVVLFGSFSKAEIKEGSDIDIAVFTVTEKSLDLSELEKKAGRSIQLFMFKNERDVKNKSLLKNMHNGFILSGSWRSWT